DGHIFAVPKCVVPEPIAAPVVVPRGLVVVEPPARVLGTARLVDEAAEFVVLAIPESTHAAMFAVFPPKVDIDASIGIERSDEFIAVLVRARGKFLRAGEIEPNALEHVRQLGHDGPPRSGAGAIADSIARRTVSPFATLKWFDARQEHRHPQADDAPSKRQADERQRVPRGGLRAARRPRDPWRRGGQAHRYPCRLGISRRRPRAEGQARGALSVSRLFDPRQAQERLRGGASYQSALFS